MQLTYKGEKWLTDVRKWKIIESEASNLISVHEDLKKISLKALELSDFEGIKNIFYKYFVVLRTNPSNIPFILQNKNFAMVKAVSRCLYRLMKDKEIFAKFYDNSLYIGTDLNKLVVRHPEIKHILHKKWNIVPFNKESYDDRESKKLQRKICKFISMVRKLEVEFHTEFNNICRIINLQGDAYYSTVNI